MKKLRWGILSTAKIGRTFVIPALQASDANEVVAIASRDLSTAQTVGRQLDIPQVYGSYAQLLSDPTVDAIYNPLPNHLHVPLTIKALEAGKHVLCEKPVGLNAAEVQALISAAQGYPHLNVMEGFMYRFHPQWVNVADMIREQSLGRIRTVHAQFTYCKDEPNNIRNKPEMGGGGLMDIGVYGVSAARLLFNTEPLRVSTKIVKHPDFDVDVIASGMLEFADGLATFSCATQVEASQFVIANGEHGSIYIESPFTRLQDEPSRVTVTRNKIADVREFDGGDHYMDMVDAFAEAIFNGKPAPLPLDDGLNNMKVIDAAFASARSERWVDVA